MYNEAEDVAEHRLALDAMDKRFAAAQLTPDWASATVLDLGGGGALHAGLLAARCRRVLCADVIDQHARYGGEFLRLLKEKLARFDIELPIERIEINTTNAHELMYRDAHFDVVVSFNTLEHIPDPTQMLTEVARVLKPGGACYLSFDPIWTADTGSHFFHRVPEPWAHLVLTPDEYTDRMRTNGAEQWELDEFRYAMNRVRLEDFERLFRVVAPSLGLELAFETSWSGVAHERHTAHPNFVVARETFSERELLFRGTSLIFGKVGDKSK